MFLSNVSHKAGRTVSRRYRSRRIGEFLKELEMTEGRSTGVPKILKEMAASGSPSPLFETDDDRLSFVVGQKLFGEVMLENRGNPLFSEFWPQFLDFMKKLKGFVKQ